MEMQSQSESDDGIPVLNENWSSPAQSDSDGGIRLQGRNSSNDTLEHPDYQSESETWSQSSDDGIPLLNETCPPPAQPDSDGGVRPQGRNSSEEEDEQEQCPSESSVTVAPRTKRRRLKSLKETVDAIAKETGLSVQGVMADLMVSILYPTAYLHRRTHARTHIETERGGAGRRGG